MTEREIRYCRAEDGVRIAYCSEGSGAPLIMCPGRGESFALSHLSPELEVFLQGITRGRRLIRYDERGTGLSQREITNRSHDAFVSDLAAVADASGVGRFSLWASCLSGPRAIVYACEHPDRVERLLLYGTTANARDFMAPLAEAYGSLARANWKMWARTFVEIGCNRKHPGVVDGLSEMLFESSTGENAALTIIEGSKGAYATAHAAMLQMPTLVLHGTEDFVVLPEHGYDLTAVVPDVRFISLTGAVSFYFLGDTGRLLGAIDDFLGPAANAAPAADDRRGSGVLTVLFTDIVGHTEMMQRLGDAKGREVLREHERITRETLKQHGGAEVKTMGDGFMASFGSVTKAMECAIALQRAFAAHADGSASHSHVGAQPVAPVSDRPRMPEPIAIRIGLNAGEPIEEDGDLFGATVILASRIAAKAAGGEILIPEPVRHLLSGKAFTFSDRGEHAMKGFDDAVRLYEVRWRE